MRHKVGIVSLGCDKNLINTEEMLSKLSDDFEITNNQEEADILIVNTCGFIESAKQESINTLLEMADYKENGKCKVLIAAGCLAQRYKNQIFEEMPEVDAVVGTGSYNEIADAVHESLNGEKSLKLGGINFDFEVGERIVTTPEYTAYLKIAEGCDNHCTYCIIPKLRGKYRSRKLESIYNEAVKLVQNGAKELIIIAQDITRYGIDNYNKKMLPELLNRLCTIDDLKWIRLLYSYPEGIDDELIDVIKNQDKICKYIDIPMQHCSNDVLKLMGRKSRKEDLVKLIAKLRQEIPDISIRTTFIVGFPGETQDNFNELLDFINQMKLDRVGVFEYSKEEDTAAAKLKGHIPKRVKAQRYKKLMETQSIISFENNTKMIGKRLKVLVEGKYEGNIYFGRSYKDAPEIDGLVYFQSKKKITNGSFISVNIVKADEYDLTGEISDESSK